MEIEKIKTLKALSYIANLLGHDQCFRLDCDYCPYNNLCELIILLADDIDIL